MAHEVVRKTSAAERVEIEIDFTRPVYLVKMLFPTGTVFMSSGPQITFDGDIYIEGQVSVGTIRWNANGQQSGMITLSNENNAATALILGSSVNDVKIEIYQTYLIAAGGNTAPSFYLKGSMDGSKVGPSRSEVRVLSTASETGFVPNRYYTAAEGFLWLPIDGEVVVWGEEVFVLQADQL